MICCGGPSTGVRCNGERLAHSLAYALNNDFKDLPDELGNLQRPVVYQLFGRVSAIQDSYAVTDEDLLEFVHNLQIEDRRPRRLFEALASNHLLVLGGGFPPWLVRFFLRAVKQRGAPALAGARSRGLRGRPHRPCRRRLRGIPPPLQRSHAGLLGRAPSSSRSWVAAGAHLHPSPRTPAGPAPSTASDTPRHAVFLSYASEDRTVVERIKRQLQGAGVDPGLDCDDLKPASGWRRPSGPTSTVRPPSCP